MTAPYFRSIDSTPVSTEEALREWAAATRHRLNVSAKLLRLARQVRNR